MDADGMDAYGMDAGSVAMYVQYVCVCDHGDDGMDAYGMDAYGMDAA